MCAHTTFLTRNIKLKKNGHIFATSTCALLFQQKRILLEPISGISRLKARYQILYLLNTSLPSAYSIFFVYILLRPPLLSLSSSFNFMHQNIKLIMIEEYNASVFLLMRCVLSFPIKWWQFRWRTLPHVPPWSSRSFFTANLCQSNSLWQLTSSVMIMENVLISMSGIVSSGCGLWYYLSLPWSFRSSSYTYFFALTMVRDTPGEPIIFLSQSVQQVASRVSPLLNSAYALSRWMLTALDLLLFHS